MTNDISSQPDKSQIDRIICFITDAFEDFAINENMDRKFFALLANDFDALDIEDELKQYHAWTLDQPRSGRRVNHHSRIRQWLKRAMLTREYRQ